MDLYSVSISYEIFVLSESAADAEKVAAELCEDANSCMPGDGNFRYNASKTHNQTDAFKAKAIDRSMT
jgi:hypothetical protein